MINHLVLLIPLGKASDTESETLIKEGNAATDATRTLPGKSGMILEELPLQKGLVEETRDKIVGRHCG
jgi:hypothetical protein